MSPTTKFDALRRKTEDLEADLEAHPEEEVDTDLEAWLTPPGETAEESEVAEDMADSEEAEAYLDAMEAAHKSDEKTETDEDPVEAETTQEQPGTEDAAEAETEAETTQEQPGAAAEPHSQHRPGPQQGFAFADEPQQGFAFADEPRPQHRPGIEEESPETKQSGADPFSALLMAPFSISARLAQGAQQRIRAWRGQRAAAAVAAGLGELSRQTHEMRARTEDIVRVPRFDQLRQAIDSEADPLRREALERFLNDEVNQWRQGAGRQTVAELEQAMDRIERLSRSMLEKARRHPEHINLNQVRQAVQQELGQVDDALQPLQRIRAEALNDLRERMRKIEQMLRQIIDAVDRLLQRLGLGGRSPSPSP